MKQPTLHLFYSSAFCFFLYYHRPYPQTGKIRARSPTFLDHFSQPGMIYNSMTEWEKAHLISAFSFELNSVKNHHIRERLVNKILFNINPELAQRVADRIAVKMEPVPVVNPNIKLLNLRAPASSVPSISLDRQPLLVKGRKCAVICCDGVDGAQVKNVIDALTKNGVVCEVVAPSAGKVKTGSGGSIPDAKPLTNAPPVMYDYCFIADCNEKTADLAANAYVQGFANGFFNHGKHIADGSKTGTIFESVGIEVMPDNGLFGNTKGAKAGAIIEAFVNAILRIDRFHSRQLMTRLGLSTAIHV